MLSISSVKIFLLFEASKLLLEWTFPPILSTDRVSCIFPPNLFILIVLFQLCKLMKYDFEKSYIYIN